MKNILLLMVFLALSFAVNAQVVFSENFEIPDSVVSSGNPTWAPNQVLQTSGMWSMNNKTSLNDTSRLTTIAFSTLGKFTLRLKFWHICKIEFFDGGYVEVSPDSGLTWIRLREPEYMGFGPFGVQGDKFSSAFYAQWLPGLNNAIPSPAWWQHEEFNLPLVMSNKAHALIRFVLHDGNANGANFNAGWFIDDIEVRALQIPDLAVVAIPAMPGSLLHGQTISTHAVVQNTGAFAYSSFTLSVAVNNNPVLNIPWTGSLFSVDTVHIPMNLTFSGGLNSIRIYLSSTPDSNQLNDTLKISRLAFYMAMVPYSDNFDSLNIWVPMSINNGYNTQWELGTPAYGATSGAISSPNSWDINLTQPYSWLANAILYSPVFDFSAATNMHLRFMQNRNTQPIKDGFRLEYSVNNLPWQVLGAMGAGGSFNWYTVADLDSSGLPAWDGNSIGWNASFIPLLPIFNGASSVQFRFVFTSNGSINLDGVSIDDFEISPVPFTPGAPTYSTITGRVFKDLNNNLIQDAGEPGLPNIVVQSTPNGFAAMTDPNGDYTLLVTAPGSYSITVANKPIYHTLSPATHSVSFAAPGMTSPLNNFALYPIPFFMDLSITSNSNSVRPGANASFYLVVRNLGNLTANGVVVKFVHDNRFNYMSSLPPHTSYSPDTLTYTLGTVAPWTTHLISVWGIVSTSAMIGDTLISHAWVTPFAGDYDTLNNYFIIKNQIVNAYDPNDKQVYPEGDITTAQVSAGFDLNYTIRFMNTGNDTAYVVVLTDTLDLNLDPGSLQMIASSHPYTLSLSGNRTLNWTFHNIMLPDSTTNFIGSQGFVKYSVKPYSTTPAWTLLKNTAHIFFDFNPAIVTNTTVTQIVNPVGLHALSGNGKTVMTVYPNPASNEFTIECDAEFASPADLSLINSHGQQVYYNPIRLMKGKNRIVPDCGKLVPGMYTVRIGGIGLNTTARVVVY
jgi:uncharacterized repeat protein (TIGR01451 family)